MMGLYGCLLHLKIIRQAGLHVSRRGGCPGWGGSRNCPWKMGRKRGGGAFNLNFPRVMWGAAEYSYIL